MKVYLFENEPWVKAAWQSTGTKVACMWVDGLLMPDNVRGCAKDVCLQALGQSKDERQGVLGLFTRMAGDTQKGALMLRF